jgi:hypothetical protein
MKINQQNIPGLLRSGSSGDIRLLEISGAEKAELRQVKVFPQRRQGSSAEKQPTRRHRDALFLLQAQHGSGI